VIEDEESTEFLVCDCARGKPNACEGEAVCARVCLRQELQFSAYEILRSEFSITSVRF